MTAVQFDWLQSPEVICYAQQVQYKEDKRALLLSLFFALVWCWREQLTQEQCRS